MKFYDNDGQEIWNNTPYWNDTSKRISFLENVELTSGTYYFSISRYDGNGTYEFNLAYEDCGESYEEGQGGSNNTFKSASEIDVDESYVGQIAINDETDIYKFTLNNSGGLALSLNAENMRRLNMKFYDNDGQEIWNNTPYWNDTSKRISFSENVTLTDGTYYFSVSKYDGYGTYEFSLNTENSVQTQEKPDRPKDELINGDDKSQENTIKVRTSDLSIFINGEKVNFPDARPFIDSADRTQVPVRFVTEKMGYEVNWHEREEIVEIYTLGVFPSTELYIKINENYITLYYDGDGNIIYMDTISQIVDDRTYIPLRYVAEALGYTVEWE